VNVNPSRNQFYDAKWKDKEERAFSSWMNFVLTPDDFKQFAETQAFNLAKDVGTAGGDCSNEAAMSKETASWRTYQHVRQMNVLRVAAHRLINGETSCDVVKHIELIVDTGKIGVRPDRHMWKDLGRRQTIVNLLMSYNPLWMRIALEVCFGETVPVRSGDQVGP